MRMAKSILLKVFLQSCKALLYLIFTITSEGRKACHLGMCLNQYLLNLLASFCKI